MPDRTAIPAGAAWRTAEMRRLAAAPFTTTERIGFFASLCYEERPDVCAFLLLLDRTGRLCGVHDLYRGRPLPAERYVSQIRDAVESAGAASVVLCVAAADPHADPSRSDVDAASRGALWCEYARIPVREALVLTRSDYTPLYRYYSH